jgi:hypothetical protein
LREGFLIEKKNLQLGTSDSNITNNSPTPNADKDKKMKLYTCNLDND